MSSIPAPPPPPVAPPPPSPIVGKLAAMRQAIADSLIERDDEADVLVRCLVAHENPLFVGPPGVAKSLMFRNLSKCIADLNEDTYFECLLGKYTEPSELFGPIRVSGLKEDRYVRKIERYMPSAYLVFADEIWKASTAILNTLLTILNEHEYDNDGVRIKCPLRMAGAASNEWPAADELGALFDRFLVRRVVRPVSRANRAQLLTAKLTTPSPCITLAELDLAHQQAIALPVSDETIACLLEIEEELDKQGIVVGDRRMRKAIGIAQAEAFINNATIVEPIHLEPLADVLWTDPVEHPTKTLDVVTRLANPKQSVVNRLLTEISEIDLKHAEHNDSARRTASRKLLEIESTAKAIGTSKAMRVATLARKNWNAIQLASLNLSAKAASLVTG